MADGFLGRWSQRKHAAKEDKAFEEPVVAPIVESAPQKINASVNNRKVVITAPSVAEHSESPEPLPLPTMDDVQLLNAESDFSSFVAKDVTPEVRNAAMKKLFTDPHYNVMDRLDIYIDDYSKPDPLPESMLRQMVSAKFLKLFEEVEEAVPKEVGIEGKAIALPASNQLAEEASSPAIDSEPEPAVVQTDNQTSLSKPSNPTELITDHDYTDLRLQPNHALGSEEFGRRTE